MTTTPNTQRTNHVDSAGLESSRLGLARVTRRAPRRMGQWAASLLFVAIVVLGLVALFEAESDRVEVLVATETVPAGQVVERADLRSAQVAGVAGAIPASDVDEIVGQRAAAGLVDGQVLTDQAVTGQVVPGEGERLVALNLPSGRVPGELVSGAAVDVLAAPVEGAQGTQQQLRAPTVLAESVRVQHVTSTPEGSVVVTVLVSEDLADPLAAFSAASRVTLIQAPTGSDR